MLLSSGIGYRDPLTAGFYDLLQDRGQGEGRSYLPASAVSSDSFGVKCSKYGNILGIVCPEPYQR